MRRLGRLRRLERYGSIGGALLAAALAAPAAAQELPENNSGTGQYVEPVPDAGGDRPAAPGAGGGGGGGPSSGSGGGTLPPSARDALPAGEEGQVLERIATDPGSGAPSDSGRRPNGGRGSGDDRDAIPTADGEGAIAAVASAAAGDDGPAFPIILLGALGLALGAAGWRFRATRA